jgi:transcriptional regulator with XRE-family HTH domain
MWGWAAVNAFGHDLRRRRVARGYSLQELSGIAHYTKGHLSKIEKGVRAPSPELAWRLDRALEAEGELAGLLPDPKTPATPARSTVTALDAGQHIPDWAEVSDYPPVVDVGTLTAYTTILSNLRALGQRTRPAEVLAVGAPFVDTLCAVAQRAQDRDREAALSLASRYAEYLSWMAQENADDTNAMWWIQRAVAIAGRAGDPTMASYAHIRRAELALYRDDAVGVLVHAQRALSGHAAGCLRSAALQRRAQGHAIRNDERECREALDQSIEKARPEPSPPSGLPPLGGMTMPDPLAFVTGWCMQDLSRPGEAIDALAPQFDRISEGAVRVRARCGARLALALTSSGELDQACSVAEQAMAATMAADSATARYDLRLLARQLRRWHSDRRVRRIQPALAAVLHREPVPRASD